MSNLPATLPAGYTSAPVVYQDQCTVPYVTFLNAKKRIYPDVLRALPQVKEGDPVLMMPGDLKPSRLSPLKYFLVGREQFWGKFNSDGVLTHYTAERPTKEMKYAEIFESILIVFVGKDLLIPASCRFKGAQVPGIAPAARALEEAALPSWADKGEDYAPTLNIEAPWARFTATTTRGSPRETLPTPERKETFRYHTLEKAQINPTVVEPAAKSEYKLLRSFFSVDEFKSAFAGVVENFKERVASAKKKAVA